VDRKIIKAVNYIKMEDEDYTDVLFWQSKSVSERLKEVARLRKDYYTWLNGSFPEKMIRVITSRANDL
jgi:hypothetical protein